MLLGFANAKHQDGSEEKVEGLLNKTEEDREDSVGLSATMNEHESVRNSQILGRQMDEGWAWEKSCHEGLFTYHDGRKRWYHCMFCQVVLIYSDVFVFSC